MPRSRRSRGLLQPADGVACGPRERRLVLGGRERERRLPPVVPAIAGPSAADLAGPSLVYAASLASSGSRPGRSRASRARPGRDEVRSSAGRPTPGLRRSGRSSVLPCPDPRSHRVAGEVDGHVMIAGRGTAAPSRIHSRLRGVPKRWYAGSHDPITRLAGSLVRATRREVT